MTAGNQGKSITMEKGFIRFLYVGFVVLGIGRLVFQGPAVLSDAMASLGIALAFDPFNASVSWSERPLYQRVWLLVHVSVVLIMLGVVIYQKWA